MTRQLTRPQALQLGGIVLVGLAVATWLMLKLDERRGLGSDALVVEAGFSDIAGVEVGTRVRLQGIDAGEVVAIVPPKDPGADVKLRLRLSGKLRHLVTADSQVQIASESLFAGRIVRIVPGTRVAGLAADGATLESAPSIEITENLAQSTAKINSAMDDIKTIAAKVNVAMDDVKSIVTNANAATNDTRRVLATFNAATTDARYVLAKVNAALDDINQGKGTIGMLLKDGSLYNELTAILADVKSGLNEVRQGEGTLGKLVKNNEAYAEAMQSLQDVRRMVASVKQNADAIKALPVVRSYVVDIQKELVRPDCQRFCKWFAESDLFEPGRAVLTAAGKKRLDEAAPWVNGHKEAGSEVLIAGFAKLSQNPDMAQTLTQKQSEAVCDYLKKTHSIHSTGWAWWSTRSVRPIAVGTNHPAIPGSEKLPQARIELLIFVPGT